MQVDLLEMVYKYGHRNAEAQRQIHARALDVPLLAIALSPGLAQVRLPAGPHRVLVHAHAHRGHLSAL